MLFEVDLEALIAGLGGIGFFIAMIVVVILLGVFALKVGINAVKGRNTDFGEVFVTGLILIVVNFISIFIPVFGWLIGLIIAMLVIKSRHNTTFFGALGALIIYIIVIIVIVVIFAVVFGVGIEVLTGFF